MKSVDLPAELRQPLRPSLALRLGAQLRHNHRQQERSELESRIREKEEHLNMERLHQYEEELQNKLRSRQQEIDDTYLWRINEPIQPPRVRIEADVSQGREQSLTQSYLQTYRDSIEKLSYREPEDVLESRVNPHTIIEEYEEELRNKMNSKPSIIVSRQSKSHVVNRSSLHSSRPKRSHVVRNSGKENSKSQVNKRTLSSRCHEKKEKKSKKESKVSVKPLKDHNPNETAYFTVNVEQPQKKSLSPGADLTISKANISMMTIPKNERDSKASRDTRGRKSTARTARKSKSAEVSLMGHLRDKSIFGDSLQGQAMRKISARLGLSGVVYNDQGMKFAKWPQEHMVRTFVVEQKLRKEVKDKINNHPGIMKKHSFVVSSH